LTLAREMLVDQMPTAPEVEREQFVPVEVVTLAAPTAGLGAGPIPVSRVFVGGEQSARM